MNRTLFRPITSRVNVPIRIYALSKSRYTHIVSPSDVIKRRIGLDVALKVDVRSLQDVFRVQAATKGYHCPGYIYKEAGHKKNPMDFFPRTRSVSMQTVMISDSFSGKLKRFLRVNLLSNLQWTLIMYPSSLTRSGKYSLVALQTMYFPLSSGFATNLMTDEVHSSPLSEFSEDSEATSNSRLSMNQRKRGLGRDPWHRHSNVDSLPAERALLRSPVILTAKGGTEKESIFNNL